MWTRPPRRPGWAPTITGLPLRLGVVDLLDRREEGIEVDMEKHSRAHRGVAPTSKLALTANSPSARGEPEDCVQAASGAR